MSWLWQFLGKNSGALSVVFTTLFGVITLIYNLAKAKPEQHAKVRSWIFKLVDGFFTYVLPVGLFGFAVLAIWLFVSKDGPMTRGEVCTVAFMASVVIHMVFFSPHQLTQSRHKKYEDEQQAQRIQQMANMCEAVERMNERLDRATDTKRTRI